jgi:hypothetical protein
VASDGPAVAFVFEGGGRTESAVEADLRRIRHAIACDTLEVLDELRVTGELDRVVLVTDRPDLAARVPRSVEVVPSPEPFHFGQVLTGLLGRLRPAVALVLGGAAAPLYGAQDFRRYLELARLGPPAVVQNNPQSPDVLALCPGWAAAGVELPAHDNALGHALTAVGWRRLLVENSARVNFDVDTPTDAAILAGEEAAGPAAREVLATVPWVADLRERLDRVVAALATEGSELALFGRVGPPITTYLNMHLRCRLRVFSEERGMRALGREAAGQVVSLIGRCLDALGPARFFGLLDGLCHAALFDTRVVMAHWRRPFSDADRFHSDIGAWDRVSDEALRRFTAEAFAAPVPVVLGGHSLVYGGLWLLAERALVRLAAARG